MSLASIFLTGFTLRICGYSRFLYFGSLKFHININTTIYGPQIPSRHSVVIHKPSNGLEICRFLMYLTNRILRKYVYDVFWILMMWQSIAAMLDLLSFKASVGVRFTNRPSICPVFLKIFRQWLQGSVMYATNSIYPFDSTRYTFFKGEKINVDLTKI